MYFFSYLNFIVYSISQEEYNSLITTINNRFIPDVSKVIETATPILFHKAKDKNTIVIDQNGNSLYYIDNCERLIRNEEQKITPIDLENMDAKAEILFTTEKLEDIILSFNIYGHINLDELQSTVLKRALIDKNSN